MAAIVEIRSLRRDYGDATALDGVSFAIEQGAVLALVGPNGAGKTTLLRIVAALLAPTSGTAIVGGHDVCTAPRDVHATLGFLPDFFGLYEDLRVSEYLRYFALAYRLAPDTTPGRMAQVLSLVALGDQAEAPVETLSRGMRQRLGLARTLLHDPSLLLLDEPSAGLDPASRHDMQMLLRRLAGEGKTIVVSSHILAELEDYSTHVAMLDRGRLVFAGSLEQARLAARSSRQIRLRAAADLGPVAEMLAAWPGVRGLSVAGKDATFDLDGDDAQAAELVRALVTRGVAVCSFAEATGTIQDSYLALMRREP